MLDHPSLPPSRLGYRGATVHRAIILVSCASLHSTSALPPSSNFHPHFCHLPLPLHLHLHLLLHRHRHRHQYIRCNTRIAILHLGALSPIRAIAISLVQKAHRLLHHDPYLHNLHHGVNGEGRLACGARYSINRSTNDHSPHNATRLRFAMPNSPPSTDRLRATGSPSHECSKLPNVLLSIGLPILSLRFGRQQPVPIMFGGRHELNPSVVQVILPAASRGGQWPDRCCRNNDDECARCSGDCRYSYRYAYE